MQRLCRLYEHSSKAEQLTLLREVDLCVVGVCSMAWGGHHHTTLAVGSFEATTHAVDFPQDLLTSAEAHEVKQDPDLHVAIFAAMCLESSCVLFVVVHFPFLD